MLDFNPTAEEQEFLNAFRKFCDNEIAPFVEESEETGYIPREHYRKLGSVGWNGLLHDEAYGGQNASYTMATLAQIALAETCGSTFFSAGASCGLFGGPLATQGSREQKDRYLRKIIAGDLIGCLAVTEPGAGSDVQGLLTLAQQDDNGDFVLNGQKTYITNAPLCDAALVLAKTRGADGRDLGLTHFIVDASLAGVSRGKPMKKMGLRGSPTGELFFEDVRLPADAVLGGAEKTGRGFRVTMEAFNKERLALAAYSTGVMSACITDSRRFAKERKSFGRKIDRHQSVAFMLADMYTKYEAARLLTMETAWLFDQAYNEDASTVTAHASASAADHGGGTAVLAKPQSRRSRKLTHNGQPLDLTARSASVKLLASTYAREVTNLAVQIHGGAGYMEEYRVCRLYRDVKLAEIGGGTSEIQKQIIARSEEKRVRG